MIDREMSQRERAAAWIITGVVFGYCALGRGFSFLGVGVAGVPIYVGEIALLSCAALLGRQSFVGLRSKNGLFLALWMCLGAVLFFLPSQQRNALAFRDVAMIAYGGFAPLSYWIARRGFHERLFNGVLLGVVVAVFRAALLPLDDKLLRIPLRGLRGVSLFSLRPDWAAVLALLCLFTLLLGIMPRVAAGRVTRGFLLLSCLWVLAITQVRAAYVAAFFGALVVAIFSPRVLLRKGLWLSFMGIAALILVLPNAVFESAVRPATAELKSIVLDTPSEHSTSEGTKTARLEAWRSNISVWGSRSDWTFFGMGYGQDLAPGLKNASEVENRYPHNIVVTILVRTGVIGLVFWMLFNVYYLVGLYRAARAFRMTGATRHAKSVVWLAGFHVVVLASACFGVLLEVPFAAIPWFSAIGLGLFLQRQSIVSLRTNNVSLASPPTMMREMAGAHNG